MNNRITLSLTVIFCAYLLTGCVTVMKSDSLKAVPIEPVIEPLPVAADLIVAGQRSKGEVSGSPGERDKLLKDAVAKALGQEAPRTDNPDILVGKEVFEEVRGGQLNLTVTGYPARYTNFRAAGEEDTVRFVLRFDGLGGVPSLHTPPEDAADAWQWELEEPEDRGYADAPQGETASALGRVAALLKDMTVAGWYLEADYMLPVTYIVSSFGIDIGGGISFGNKMFLGLELGFGVGSGPYGGEDSHGLYVNGQHFWDDTTHTTTLQLACALLNVGKEYDISPDMKLVYGAALGILSTYSIKTTGETYNPSRTETLYGVEMEERNYYFGIFAKLRYRFVELSYKGFIGGSYHNQLTAGVHFQF